MKRLERRLCAFSRNVYMKMDYHDPKIVIPKIGALPNETINDGSINTKKKIVMDIYDDSEIPFVKGDSDIPFIKDAIKNKGITKNKEYIYVLNHMLVDAYKSGNVNIIDEAPEKEVNYKYASFIIRFGKKKKKKMDVDVFFETKSMTCNVFISISVKYMMKRDEWFMNKLIKGIARNVDTFRNGDAYGRFKDEEVAALMQIASDYLCNETCMPIIEFKF